MASSCVSSNRRAVTRMTETRELRVFDADPERVVSTGCCGEFSMMPTAEAYQTQPIREKRSKFGDGDHA